LQRVPLLICTKWNSIGFSQQLTLLCVLGDVLGLDAVALLILRNRLNTRRSLIITACVVVAALAVFTGILAAHWPFTRQAIIKDLAENLSARVEIKSFRETYFPPGCIAEGVIFRLPAGRRKALVNVQRLTIKGSYLGILTKHVRQVVAEGLRVVISPGTQSGEQGARASGKKPTILEEVQADGAVLQVSNGPDQEFLVFRFQQLRLSSLSVDRGGEFHVLFENPKPPALVESTGHIGPVSSHSLAQIPVKGWFTLAQGNLGAFSAIAGMLSAKGQFEGPLERLAVQGSTEVLNFEVIRSGHRLPVTLEFRGLVNGMTGDTNLQAVHGRIQNTTFSGTGTIMGIPGKTVAMSFTSSQSRIEDLFMLLSNPPHSPITGVLQFQVKTSLPPEDRQFIEKVSGEGDFDITNACFTSSKTQYNVDKLSERSRGDTKEKDIEPVIAHLKGHVALKNGVATFSDFSFNVPGESAQVRGTYNFLDHRVDLKGTLRMEAKLSQATTGIKSFFARFLNSRFETKNAGAEMPIRVTGTDNDPHFQVELKRSKRDSKKNGL
jgi:hypothetical protein